jgi:hypothetical protein
MCSFEVKARGVLTLRSPGLEEYIEGLSFLWYLDKKELITLADVQQTLSDPETGEPVSLVLDHES